MKNLIPMLLTILPLLACTGDLSQSRLDALSDRPVAERLPEIEALMVKHPGDARLSELWSDTKWEELSTMDPVAKIEHLKASLRENPENGLLSKLLGDAYSDHAHGAGGDSYLDSALFAYENAALKMPDYLPAVGSVGSLYDEMEDYDQAVFWYDRALSVRPDHVPTLVNLGASLYNKGDSNKAMDAYRKALEVDPDSQDAHYNLGVAFAEAQLYREAVVEWDRVVEIDPATPVAGQAKSNSTLLKEVLAETSYKGGRKVKRQDRSDEPAKEEAEKVRKKQ